MYNATDNFGEVAGNVALAAEKIQPGLGDLVLGLTGRKGQGTGWQESANSSNRGCRALNVIAGRKADSMRKALVARAFLLYTPLGEAVRDALLALLKAERLALDLQACKDARLALDEVQKAEKLLGLARAEAAIQVFGLKLAAPAMYAEYYEVAKARAAELKADMAAAKEKVRPMGVVRVYKDGKLIRTEQVRLPHDMAKGSGTQVLDFWGLADGAEEMLKGAGAEPMSDAHNDGLAELLDELS